MKQLFTLLLLCTIFSSCQKKYADLSGFVYLRFALLDKNDVVLRVYHIRDGKLYNHSPGDRNLMTNDQYLKAQKVMNEIPEVLITDTSAKYSCHCPSYEKIVLIYYRNNKESVQYIDLKSTKPPRKVQLFADKVYRLIAEFEP